MTKTKNYGDKIRHRLANDPELAAKVDDAALNMRIAEEIFRIRNERGLSQKNLAELAKTHQSVIARLEDANYQGYSVKTLARVARALGCKLFVEFYDAPKYLPLPPVQHSMHFNYEFDDTLSDDQTAVEIHGTGILAK